MVYNVGAMENPKFGQGECPSEWAVKGIRERVVILQLEGEQEIAAASAFPDNPAADQHKAIGENMISAAARIETELNLLADSIDRILGS